MAKSLNRGITWKNLNHVIDTIHKKKDKMLFEDAKNICSEVGNETIRRMQEDAPKDTGELMASIHMVEWSNRLRFRLKADSPYAKYQNTGAKPHKIQAKNARYLSFWWQNAGIWFIGKSVNHPGVEGNRFFSDNVDWCQRTLFKRLKTLMNEWGYKK